MERTALNNLANRHEASMQVALELCREALQAYSKVDEYSWALIQQLTTTLEDVENPKLRRGDRSAIIRSNLACFKTLYDCRCRHLGEVRVALAQLSGLSD